MFGLFKSYDDEYLELYEYMTQNWEMKPEYAKIFLNTYKKSVGKMFSTGKKRMAALENSADLDTRLMATASGGQDPANALVFQAYKAYMTDLRRGVHVGTPVELAIWAVLSNRSDLIGIIDRAFEIWIFENHEKEFPDLFEEVFQSESENNVETSEN